MASQDNKGRRRSPGAGSRSVEPKRIHISEDEDRLHRIIDYAIQRDAAREEEKEEEKKEEEEEEDQGMDDETFNHIMAATMRKSTTLRESTQHLMELKNDSSEKPVPLTNTFEARRVFWEMDKSIPFDTIYGTLNPIDKGPSPTISTRLNAHPIARESTTEKEKDRALIQCSIEKRLLLFQRIKASLKDKLSIMGDETQLYSFFQTFSFDTQYGYKKKIQDFFSKKPVNRIYETRSQAGLDQGVTKFCMNAQVNGIAKFSMPVVLLFSRCYSVPEEMHRVMEFNIGVFLSALVAVGICPCFPLIMHLGMIPNHRNPRYAKVAEAFMVAEAADRILGELQCPVHPLYEDHAEQMVRAIGRQLLYAVFCLHTYASVCHWDIHLKNVMVSDINANNEMVFSFPGIVPSATSPEAFTSHRCPYLVKLIDMDHCKPYSEDAAWFDYSRVMSCCSILASRWGLSKMTRDMFLLEESVCRMRTISTKEYYNKDSDVHVPLIPPNEHNSSQSIFESCWSTLTEGPHNSFVPESVFSEPPRMIFFTYKAMTGSLRKEVQSIYHELMFKPEIDKK